MVMCRFVIDLMDSENQRVRNKRNTAYPNDQVAGYTLQQLEASLKKAPNSVMDWKEKIKSMHDNSTEKYVDGLFNTYD